MKRGYFFDGGRLPLQRKPLEPMDPKILEDLERLAPDSEYAREALELLRGNDELMRQEQTAACAVKDQAKKSRRKRLATPAEALSDAA